MIYLFFLAVAISCSKIGSIGVQHKINFVDVATASGGGSILVAAGVPQQFKPLVDFLFAPIRLQFKAINYGIGRWFESLNYKAKKSTVENKLLTSIKEKDITLAEEVFKVEGREKIDVNKSLKLHIDGQETVTYFLHLAIDSAAPERIVDLILERGHTKLRDSAGRTALMIAMEKRDMNSVFKIMGKSDVVMDAEKVAGMHLVHMAAAGEKVGFLDEMCKKDPFCLIMSSDIEILGERLLPLDFAALFGRENMVKKIIHEARNKNIILKGSLAFNLAAALGSERICKLLLENGITPSKVKGNNVLHFLGLKRFFKDYVKLNDGMEKVGLVALIHFEVGDESSILDFLLNLGDKDGNELLDLKSMFEERNAEGDMPIHTAARFGDYRLLEELAKKFLPVERKRETVREFNLLAIAKENLDSKLASCLNDYLDQEEAIKSLEFFAQRGNKEDLFCLLSRIVKRIALTEEVKSRLLSKAAPKNRGYLEKLFLLYDYGTSGLFVKNVLFNEIELILVDINKRDERNGKSYLNYCVEIGNLEMLELLVKKGAKLTYSLLQAAIKNDFAAISAIFPNELFSSHNGSDTLLDLIDETKEWLVKDLIRRRINFQSSNLAISALRIRSKIKDFCENFLEEILYSCSLDYQDYELNTIFHFCALNNQVRELDILLSRLKEEGSDALLLLNNEKEKALDLAIRLDHHAIVKQLLDSYPEQERRRELGLGRPFFATSSLGKAKKLGSKETEKMLSYMREKEVESSGRAGANTQTSILDTSSEGISSIVEETEVNLFKLLGGIGGPWSKGSSEMENRLRKEIKLGNNTAFGLLFSKYLELGEATEERKLFILKCLIKLAEIKQNPMLHLSFEALKKKGDSFLKKLLQYRTAHTSNFTLSHILPLVEDNNGIVLSIAEEATELDQCTNTGITPLMLASYFGRAELCKLLIEKGANVNQREYSGGFTSLMLSSQGGHVEVCRLLLENGASPNSASHSDITSLMLAALKGHSSICRMLLERGANPNSADEDVDTALILASAGGHADVCRILLNKGAQVNISNLYASTALIRAAMNGDLEICRMLVESGADVNAKNLFGCTPLIAAASDGHVEICKLLIDNAATVEINGYPPRFVPLICAAENGHLEVCELLVIENADVNAKNSFGSTPLIAAASKGHTEVCELFLNKRANVEAKNLYGSTPLISAARDGHIKACRLLIEEGANVNARRHDGATSLILAAKYGHIQICELLMEMLAKLDAQDNHQNTLLIFAAGNGRLEVCMLLIDRNVDVNAQNSFGSTPLIAAASSGHIEICELLLNRLASIEARDSKQATPLILAAQNGHIEVCKLLIEKGANIEARDSEQATPLVLAAVNRRIGICRLLIEKGANLNAKDVKGNTVLIGTSRHGKTEIGRLLIERRVISDIRDAAGNTPLILASQNGHIGMCRLLIENMADVNSENTRKETSLMLAAQNGYTMICRMLIERNANVNAQNFRGYTPLMFAAQAGRIEAFELLIESGADVNARSHNGTTTLMLAAAKGHEMICSILLDREGVSAEIRNDMGLTALLLASENQHSQIRYRLSLSLSDSSFQQSSTQQSITEI